MRNTIVWLTVFCRPNLLSLCNLWWESHSPLPWLTAVVAKQGSSGSETRCERLGIPLSGNWQWDNCWKDVFFTTPSVCQVWGGKVGYDEVEGEIWVNCDFYFSLFEGQGRPSFGGLWSLSYLWPRLWHERGRANRQSKSLFCVMQFHCNIFAFCPNFSNIHINIWVKFTIWFASIKGIKGKVSFVGSPVIHLNEQQQVRTSVEMIQRSGT